MRVSPFFVVHGRIDVGGRKNATKYLVVMKDQYTDNERDLFYKICINTTIAINVAVSGWRVCLSHGRSWVRIPAVSYQRP